MAKAKQRQGDSALHLKTEEGVVRYFEACLEEAGDATAFIAKGWATSPARHEPTGQGQRPGVEVACG